MKLEPLHYTLQIEPNLAKFMFSGRVKVSLAASAEAAEVVLNLVEIAVWSCKLRQGDDPVECLFTVDPRAQELRVNLPAPVSGEIVLEIEYSGRINDAMAGFYRSRYLHDGETRYLAVTQFQESDARRAFPCIDHPAAKATFDIELVIPPHLTAVANTPVREEEKLTDGSKRVMFERTPRMSTYLVFWAVGEFEFMEDTIDPRVRVVTLPGKKEFGGLALELGRKALDYCESYYGIPYPLPKLDLLAIPEFAFGAMENWGAIAFRENLLLYYPGTTSRAGEERIFEVIAHEIAHQWFGNLVTPADWKYIWLNESFATLFGFGVIAHFQPEWDTWEHFLNGTTASAMARDGIKENFAIELPGETQVVINTSTAPIIYSKGGSILRQIRGYLGEDSFRKGLRLYLQTHAYDSTASRHFWAALANAADRPVEAIMKSWVEQPGLPLVTAARDKNQLKLRQQRFTYLPGGYAQEWLIPLSINLYTETGEERRLHVLLDQGEDTVELPADTRAYTINGGRTGFYRVRYDDPGNMGLLAKMIDTGALPPEERWGLQNDLFALVVSGTLLLTDYLAFLDHYQTEVAYLPAASITANLAHAYRVVSKEQRNAITAWSMPWLERVLDTIGYEPKPTEPFSTTVLRDRLLGDAVLYGSEKITELSAHRFKALQQGGTIHPDIMRATMLAGAWNGDSSVFDWFIKRLRTAAAEHERLNILTALGFFRTGPEVEGTLRYVLDEVPARNKFVPIMAIAANPFAAGFLWEWFVGNLAPIERFHPMILERVLAAVIPAAGLIRPDEVQRFFADYLAQKVKARDVVKLALERLAIDLRMRELNRG
jgi:aminopeptidase N